MHAMNTIRPSLPCTSHPDTYLYTLTPMLFLHPILAQLHSKILHQGTPYMLGNAHLPKKSQITSTHLLLHNHHLPQAQQYQLVLHQTHTLDDQKYIFINLNSIITKRATYSHLFRNRNRYQFPNQRHFL